MHEKRNFAMVLLLSAGLLWAAVVWFMLNPDTTPLVLVQRIASTLLVLTMAGWLIYALRFEDKLPDHMGRTVGEMYYGVDGLTFMPTIRAKNGHAELCVFYQNRYENPAEVIVHLRPPEGAFIIRPGLHDVHFAFRAGGGDFGVIHQPIAVPEHLQGEVINVHLAAASHYPRSQGARLRKRAGLPCGSMPVDWSGSAFKTGVHQVSGEIELLRPATLHLSMPTGVNAFTTTDQANWRQELLISGPRS